MGMDTIFWLAAVAVFLLVETATAALVSVWFAVGAAAALVLSFFTASAVIQFVTFAVVSGVVLLVMIPTLARRRKARKPPVTNGSGLAIGKRGVVLRAIQPGEIGRDTPLAEGAHCEVTAAEGAVLTVRAVTAAKTPA